jgi:hypothetical protein
VGKFDKFGAFALALPTMLLGLITLFLAISYTNREFDVGLFGFPGKNVLDWNSGSEAVSKLSGSVQITGFETHNYIGETISRAYILLGQDLSEGKERRYSLSQSKIKELCGGVTSGIEVKREWENQIVRRYVEARSSK